MSKMFPVTCRNSMSRALAALVRGCDQTYVEGLTHVVDTSMGGLNREYHVLKHALDVADSADPIEILVGLFHDIIQIEADGEITSACIPFIEDLIEVELHPVPLVPTSLYPTAKITLREKPYWRQGDVAEIVCSIFKMAPAIDIAGAPGHNEFLSALVAARALERRVSTEAITNVVLGIEATIPFRAGWRRSLKESRDALVQIKNKLDLKLTNSDFDLMMRRVVDVANRDVESFASDDLGRFLNDTFSLMLEADTRLRSVEGIPVIIYRKRLQKMRKFLASISPQSVFREMDDELDPAANAARLRRTERNLQVVDIVLSTRLLVTVLVEAVNCEKASKLRLIHSAKRHIVDLNSSFDEISRDLLRDQAGWAWKSDPSLVTLEVEMHTRCSGNGIIQRVRELQSHLERVDSLGDLRSSKAVLEEVLDLYTSDEQDCARQLFAGAPLGASSC